MGHQLWSGYKFPLIWYCWLADRKGIWSLKTCATYLKGSLLKHVEEGDQQGLAKPAWLENDHKWMCRDDKCKCMQLYV